MRRKDREVTEFAKIVEIAGKCKVCRIAMHDEPAPYIVPMNFGYAVEDGKLVIYVHGAKVGKKADLMAKNPNVCFEADTEHALIENEDAGETSFAYASVIGFGKAERLEETDAVINGLSAIFRHQTGMNIPMTAEMVKNAAVWRIALDSVTGKRRPEKG